MLQQEKPNDFLIATGETNTLESFIKTLFGCFGMDWHDHVDVSKDLFRSTDIVAGYARQAKQPVCFIGKQARKKRAVVEGTISSQLTNDPVVVNPTLIESH